MKKSTLGIIVVAAIFALVSISQFNSMVSADQNVERTISKWQSQIKRQADLLPMLVGTVQGASDQESSVLKGVDEARVNTTAMQNLNQLDIANNEALQKQLIEAQASVQRAAVNVTKEANPKVESLDLYRDLSKQIEGTQNRVTAARNDSIEAVNFYNTKVRMFPAVIFAGLFGYRVRPNFAATEEEQKTPTIDFRKK